MLGATTSHAIDFVVAISNTDLLYQALERVTDFPASNVTENNKNILRYFKQRKLTIYEVIDLSIPQTLEDFS